MRLTTRQTILLGFEEEQDGCFEFGAENSRLGKEKKLTTLFSWTMVRHLFYSLFYSSPTMASAMIDLMPAFTFILAVITGMEILDLRISSGNPNCIGTVVSISGAKCFRRAEGGCCPHCWGG
ncbi:hypothetical protein Pyn_07208 [Prunus yedoensis var. nudiflora]|uniref:WAT1-related protein n=1 Tax=Prunus yedoensis var. nudiflora TaxID=2094558 RepID=A0A314Z6K2_PRUYE|nr:hypothetical protein Pyn_07208 [Prunus yedoensis var. nudiflora]